MPCRDLSEAPAGPPLRDLEAEASKSWVPGRGGGDEDESDFGGEGSLWKVAPRSFLRGLSWRSSSKLQGGVGGLLPMLLPRHPQTLLDSLDSFGSSHARPTPAPKQGSSQPTRTRAM